jgi:ABC-type glycerol-3-phosphate transport system substrate-binding protein
MNGSTMNRRDFLQTAAATVGAATFGGALAACGGASTSSSPSGVVTINHWDWWVSQAPWVDNEIKLFEQAHPNIKIKKTTQVTNTYANLFALSVQSNNEPDVFMIAQTPNLNDQVARGWLLPLDKWATASWKDQFPQGSFHEGNNVFNGKVYSAPFSGTAPWLQLYIHHGVFKQAGLTNADGSVKIPKTWDDVARAADTINRKSNGSVYGLGFGSGTFAILPWWLELFVRGAGSPGGAYSMDNRVAKWTFATDRNYMDVIQMFMEWKNKGYFYPNSISITDEVARAYFERGKFGMTVGGIWNQAEWTTHKFTDYSLMTLPTPSATPQGYFYNTPGGWLWGVSSKTKYPDEAWAWFSWLESPAAGKRWVQMGEDLSTFTADDDPKLNPFPPFQQYVATLPLSLPGPDPTVRNPQTAHVIQQAIKPDIGDVMTGIYTGQVHDIPGTLSDLAARYEKSLTDGITQAQQQGYKVSLNDFIFTDWDITKPYHTQPASS